MKNLAVLIFSVSISACASGYNTSYIYDQIEVVNLSDDSISDVHVKVGNKRSVSCEQVTKNSVCHERFGKTRFPKQGIDLSWTHGDGTRKSQQLAPDVAAYYHTGLPLQVFLEIDVDGNVNQIFDQESSFGP